MANRPILQNIMNAALSGVRAMPSKDSSADNSSEFASDRAQYYRSYDSTPVPLNKKWMGSRDASDVARRRRTNGVAIGSFNANGEIVSFATKETLTANRALQRARSGGAIVPLKVSKKIGFSVPSAPRDLQIISIGNGSLTLSFDLPANNGNAAIIGYKYTLDGGNTFSNTFIENPFIIDELTNGETYDIQIVAVNRVGDSSLSNSVSGTPFTTPIPPVITNVVGGNTTATLTFNAPPNYGGSTITSYTVSSFYTSNAEYTEIETTIDVNETTTYPISVTLTGLTNGTSYTLTVFATNAAGDGGIATSIPVTPATVPDAPTIIDAISTSSSIAVNFTQGPDGGSMITNYSYSLDNITYTPRSPANTTSPIVISGLEQDTPYIIYIKAINSKGSSASSSIPKSTLSALTVPDAPIDLSVSSDDQTLTISFTPTSNGGSAIIKYQYSLDDTGLWIDLNDTMSPVTITGLTNDTEYTVYLRAVNSEGNGAASLGVTGTPNIQEDMIRFALSGPTKLLYDDAPNGSWLKITATDYNNLVNGIDDVSKVAATDEILNAAASGGISQSNVFLANHIGSRQLSIRANNYLFAFAVRWASKTVSNEARVYVNNTTANYTGFSPIGGYLPNLSGGNPASFSMVTNYYVLKKPISTTSANGGILGFFTGLNNLDGLGSGWLVGQVSRSTTNPTVTRPGQGFHFVTSLSADPTSSTSMIGALTGLDNYAVGMQGLTTGTKQW
jgi:Fibronectin type III domain